MKKNYPFVLKYFLLWLLTFESVSMIACSNFQLKYFLPNNNLLFIRNMTYFQKKESSFLEKRYKDIYTHFVHKHFNFFFFTVNWGDILVYETIKISIYEIVVKFASFYQGHILWRIQIWNRMLEKHWETLQIHCALIYNV